MKKIDWLYFLFLVIPLSDGEERFSPYRVLIEPSKRLSSLTAQLLLHQEVLLRGPDPDTGVIDGGVGLFIKEQTHSLFEATRKCYANLVQVKENTQPQHEDYNNNNDDEDDDDGSSKLVATPALKRRRRRSLQIQQQQQQQQQQPGYPSIGFLSVLGRLSSAPPEKATEGINSYEEFMIAMSICQLADTLLYTASFRQGIRREVYSEFIHHYSSQFHSLALLHLASFPMAASKVLNPIFYWNFVQILLAHLGCTHCNLTDYALWWVMRRYKIRDPPSLGGGDAMLPVLPPLCDGFVRLQNTTSARRIAPAIRWHPQRAVQLNDAMLLLEVELNLAIKMVHEVPGVANPINVGRSVPTPTAKDEAIDYLVNHRELVWREPFDEVITRSYYLTLLVNSPLGKGLLYQKLFHAPGDGRSCSAEGPSLLMHNQTAGCALLEATQHLDTIWDP